MKKLVSMLLALVLAVSIGVAPALAAAPSDSDRYRAPSYLTPAPEATVYGDTTTISWEDVDASRYMLFLWNQNTGDMITVEEYLSETEYTVYGLEAGESYGVTVVAVFYTAGAFASDTHFFHVASPYDDPYDDGNDGSSPPLYRAPLYMDPAHEDTVYGDTTTVSWEDVGATRYMFYFWNWNTGQMIAVDEYLSENEYTVYGLEEGYRYGFVVVAVFGDDGAYASDTHFFNVERQEDGPDDDDDGDDGSSPPLYRAPSYMTPGPEETVYGDTTTLSWEDVGATRYMFYFWNWTTGKMVVVDEYLTENEYTVYDLVAGHRYGFVVVAIFGDDGAHASETHFFTVGAQSRK